MATKREWEKYPDENERNAAWQQNMAAFADAQKRAAAQLGEQLDAANLTGAGSAAIDRVRKYRQSTPGQTANMGQTANQAAVDKASKDLVSKDLMDEFLNRDKFSYNETADPLWQQYRRRYLEAGNKAMKDTLGKATALTGGYDNSYANIAAQQVNNEYAAKAADKIPELYQLALDRYNQEGQDILSKYELLYGREQAQAAADFEREKFEYQQSRDAVEDQKWAQEFGLKANAQEWSQYMDDRQMTLNEAKFFLEQEIERGNLDIKKAQLALQKYETEQSVAQGWTKLDQSQQEINQGWTKISNDYALNDRELTMRENGTYFDRTSGSATPLVTIKTTEDRDKAVADTVQFMSNPVHTADDIDRFLDQYGDMGDIILSLAEQKIADKDRAKYYNNSRLK